MECKHWNILLLSLTLHEYQIISSFLFEMHFWHVWNICWEIIWKYYLHSSKSLVAYKCLRRNFCDVILLQASKKGEENWYHLKKTPFNRQIFSFSFLWRCANKDLFYYFMIYFLKSISLSALMFQRKRMAEDFYFRFICLTF